MKIIEHILLFKIVILLGECVKCKFDEIDKDLMQKNVILTEGF